MRISLFPMLLLWSAVTLGQSDFVFIPQSPATAEEIEGVKDNMRSAGWSESEIDKFFAEGNLPYSYRDQDFRDAYPELTDEDEMLSLCSNAIMGGAGEAVFIGEPQGNRVPVKSASCNAVEDGLQCSRLSEDQRYFFESPENLTILADGVSITEANTILSLYRENRIEGMPDWISEGFSYLAVTEISLSQQGYLLVLGELLCQGCRSEVQVAVETNGERSTLVVLGVQEGICI